MRNSLITIPLELELAAHVKKNKKQITVLKQDREVYIFLTLRSERQGVLW